MFSSQNAAHSAASSSTSQSFQYKPLTDPDSEIRLLRIHPVGRFRKHHIVTDKAIHTIKDLIPRSTRHKVRHKVNPEPNYSSKVHCDIFHVTLDKAPPYKALSYTWGSPSDDHYSIFLHRRRFLVRENLWLALQQFHTMPEPLVIWIDAVCINQADDKERNEQVAKMKTIYEQAEEVFVWLGPSYQGSHLAFQFMQKMYDHRHVVAWIAQMFTQPELRESLVALAALVNRDYWWRMWIVQELISAKSISLHCGADSIGAAALDETQSLFRAMEDRELGFTTDHLFNLLPTALNLRGWLMYRSIYDVRVFQTAFAAQSLSFFQTLLYNWDRATTDPVDMVYGLAALANSRSKYQIQINYSLSASEVYIDLARKEFQHCTTLEILTLARAGSRLPHLPSWVPDWSRADSRYFFYDITVPEYGYSAAGKSRCDIAVADAGDILVLKGVAIGKVEIVGDRPAMTHFTDLENAGPAFLSWWALLGTNGVRGERRQEQFGRTLICDQFLDQDHVGWGREECLRAVVGRFVDFISDYVPAEEIDSELVSVRSWMIQRYKEVDQHLGIVFSEQRMRDINRSWVQQSENFIWDRRFFLGSSNIMGLATEGVKAGDIICVPLGCPQPMIFRKVEDHYVVIGEAYVDGYMRGKAIEMLENGELELETFELH
ncbi:heterokaryon incompatibility protein-domain-containing protein [Cadophora sp. MPI-SDFR-AT-0126]|nr:heterokaryon incompatibility protein-domain-containing protein [Leotiomycetes sp. MPI-SDFR-AT-0126]